VKSIVKDPQSSSAPKVVDHLSKLAGELRQGVVLLYERMQNRISDFVRAYVHVIFYSIEAAYFAASPPEEIAEDVSAMSSTLLSFLSHVNSILAFRCEIESTRRILKKKVLPRLSHALDSLLPRLMDLLTSTPSPFQICMHATLAPALQKIGKDDKDLVGDVFTLTRNARRYLAVAPLQVFPDTSVSQAFRVGFLIFHSIVLISYPPATLFGAILLFRQRCLSVRPQLEAVVATGDSRHPGLEQRRGLFVSAQLEFDDAVAAMKEAPEAARAGAVTALRLAFVVASLVPEPLSAECLARALRELSELSLAQPQPADIFLLFQTAQQMALWANAWLAAAIFLDLAPRFRYSLDQPPDVVKARRLCLTITEYLEELSEFVPVDPNAVLTPVVDAALLKLRRFLAAEVHVEGEFFEAKLTKAIMIFNGYCDVISTIRARVAAFRWTRSPREVIPYLEKALALLTPLASLPADATEVGVPLVPIAGALFEIEALLQPFNVVPTSVVGDIAREAFVFLGPPDVEKVRESAEKLLQRIRSLKDGAARFTVRPPNLPTPPTILPNERKLVMEKEELLRKQIEVFDSGVPLRERTTTIMIPGGQGGSDPRTARVRSFGPGSMPVPVKAGGK
jgi:hypothetical protein